jgi:putative MFS transporter
VIGGSALLVLAYYRRYLPETARFELHAKKLSVLGSKSAAAWDVLRRLVREYPGRLTAILCSVGFFFFAIAPATVLMSKYLQQTHGWKPHQVTLLYFCGGFISVVGNMIAGRISDWIGRKRVVFACVFVCGASFAFFLSGRDGWALPVSWVFAIFGYISCDTLFAGYAAEVFPTAYRATASTLRYVTSSLSGALALALEGVAYDHFGEHGPAMLIFLAVIPLALISILFLPETSQKTLEEISHGEDAAVAADVTDGARI